MKRKKYPRSKMAKPCNGWFDWEAPSGTVRLRRETVPTLQASLQGHKEWLKQCPHDFNDSQDEGTPPKMSWDLGKGYQRCLDDMSNGDMEQVELINEIASRIGHAITGKIAGQVKRLKHDVAGGQVDVTRALSGDPEYMIRRRRIKSNSGKVIRIGVNGAAHCGIKAEHIRRHGALAMAIVTALERRGFDVGLYSIHVSDGHHGYPPSVFICEAKRPGTFVNAAKVSAIMGTPGFLRRVSFAAWEQEDDFDKRLGYGYGRPSTLSKEDAKALGMDATIEPISSWQPPGGWGSPIDKICSWFLEEEWPRIAETLGV